MNFPSLRPLALSLVLAVVGAPAHAQSAATEARPAASPAAAPTAPRSTPAPRGRAMDRVELEASRITGNRELPRVMYVVPWRQPGAGEVDGRPVNSLLYELSRPVDREVAKRELRYGQPSVPGGASPASGSAPEK